MTTVINQESEQNGYRQEKRTKPRDILEEDGQKKESNRE
jgi:hypothetical protein